MTLPMGISRVIVAAVFLMVAGCVSQSEVDELTNDLNLTRSELQTTKSQLEQAQADLAETEARLRELEAAQVESESKIQKAGAYFEVLHMVFVPSLTGEIFMMSESESVNLFLDWRDSIEATGDEELQSRFESIIDSGFYDDQMADFFLYLIESASQALD